MVHTSLRAVDINQLEVEPAKKQSWDKDLFKDLQVDPPVIKKCKSRKQKHRTAGDSKGLLNKAQRAQQYSVCREPGHNRKTCTQLVILEGILQGIGIE
jgi:hypothetical protein